MIYNLPYYYKNEVVTSEEWRPITKEMVPGVREVYWISNVGNLYNAETGHYSNATVKEDDYVRVVLRGEDGRQIMTTIHRLVCMAFNGLPPEPGYEVDHKNCIKSCSYYKNLEWVTKQENNRRAVENELLHVAEDNYHSILTNDEVRRICEMLSNGIPIDEICSIMEASIYPRTYGGGLASTVYQILNGHTWKSISKDYIFHDYSRIHLTENEIHLVCKALEAGYKYDYIIDNILNIPNCTAWKRERLKETLYNIKRGEAFADISSQYNIIHRGIILSDIEADFVCRMVAMNTPYKLTLQCFPYRNQDKYFCEAVYSIYRGKSKKSIVDKYKELYSEGSTTSQ